MTYAVRETIRTLLNVYERKLDGHLQTYNKREFALNDYHNEAAAFYKFELDEYLACLRKIEDINSIDRLSGRTLLAVFEVIVSSMQFHRKKIDDAYQLSDVACDLGEEGARNILQLAESAVHVPRGSHSSMWITNSFNKSFLYTGHPAEQHFADLVSQTESSMNGIVRLVDALRVAASSSAVEGLVENFSAAEEALHSVRLSYLKFKDIGDPENQVYGSRWFLHFRQFLAPIVLLGRKLLGPNPAHVASWPVADILLGIGDKSYVDIVLARSTSFLPDELFKLHQAVASEKVPELLAKVILCCSPEMRKELTLRFKSLHAAQIALSGMHWASIKQHLVRAADQASNMGGYSNVLSSEAGVSGRNLSITRDLLNNRRSLGEAHRWLTENKGEGELA